MAIAGDQEGSVSKSEVHRPGRRWQRLMGGLGAAVAIVVLAAAAVGPGWWPGRTLLPMGAIASGESARLPELSHAARVESAAKEIRAGHVPLWLDRQQLGVSWIAAGFGGWLVALHLLPISWSWTLAGAAQLAWGGAGAWWLGRRYALAPTPRLLMAAIFMLGGFNIAWLNLPQSSAIAWLPWIILALERLLERPTLLRMTGFTLSLAGAMLPGHAGAAAGMMLACILAGTLRLPLASPGRAAGGAILATIGAVLAAGLCGALWLPYFGYLLTTSARMASPGSSLNAPWPWPLSMVGIAPAMIATVPFLLMLMGLMSGQRRRPVVVWTLAGMASLLLAALLNQAPRWWSAAAWLTDCDVRPLASTALLAVAVLGGFGFQCLQSAFARNVPVGPGQDADAASIWQSRLEKTLLWTGLILAALALVAAGGIYAGRPRRIELLGVALRMLSPAVVLVILATVGRRRSWVWMTLGIVEMLGFSIAWHRGSKAEWPATSLIQQLQRDPDGRFSAPMDVLPPDLACAYGLDDARGTAPISHRLASLLSDTSATSRPAIVAPPRAGDLAAPFLGIARFVSASPSTQPSTQPRLWRISDTAASPLAWMASKAELAGSGQESACRLREGKVDPAQTVLVDDDLSPRARQIIERAGLSPDGWWRKRTPNAPAPVKTSRTSSGEWNVTLPRMGGWVVISQTYDPGWRARIDNRVELAVVPAFGGLCAVFVPPGRGQVRLEYDPMTWRHGCFVSAGAAVLLMLAAGAGLLTGPRRMTDQAPEELPKEPL